MLLARFEEIYFIHHLDKGVGFHTIQVPIDSKKAYGMGGIRNMEHLQSKIKFQVVTLVCYTLILFKISSGARGVEGGHYFNFENWKASSHKSITIALSNCG